MTNAQMIMEHLEALGIEFNYTEENLLTFAQWKKKGMSVKKGETAFIKLPLWTLKQEVEKDENGKVMLDENGKPKKKNVFYKKMSALFTAEQVQKAKQPKKKAKKAA